MRMFYGFNRSDWNFNSTIKAFGKPEAVSSTALVRCNVIPSLPFGTLPISTYSCSAGKSAKGAARAANWLRDFKALFCLMEVARQTTATRVSRVCVLDKNAVWTRFWYCLSLSHCTLSDALRQKLNLFEATSFCLSLLRDLGQ